MDSQTNEHDSPTLPTEQDAKVVDAAKDETPDTSLEDAVSAALKGEEPPAEGAAQTEAGNPVTDKNQEVKEGKGAAQEADSKAEEASALDKESSDDMKGRTKERFDTVLAEGKKWRETAQQHEAAMAQMKPVADWGGQVMQMLGESGGTAEDLAAGIAIIHAVARGTTENKARALEEVDKIRATLAAQLGKPISGVSHLSEFADLQKQVDDGELSPAVAEELAATRKAAKLRQEREAQDEQRRQQERQQSDAQAQHDTALRTAQSSIEQLANAYMAADGKDVYETRVQYAMNQVRLLKDMGTTVEPAKLPELFTRFYKSQEADALVNAKAVAKTRSAAGARPVMGNRMGGSGAASREPQSVEDAVLAALRGEDG